MTVVKNMDISVLANNVVGCPVPAAVECNISPGRAGDRLCIVVNNGHKTSPATHSILRNK